MQILKILFFNPEFVKNTGWLDILKVKTF